MISLSTHLPCLIVQKILENLAYVSRKSLVDKINEQPKLLDFIISSILKQAYEYVETERVYEEEIELTKEFPFRMNREENKKALVVFKEREEDTGGQSRIGFHVNPYNFDSGDERDLFRKFRNILDTDEAIKDVYFTGGITSEVHNEFFVEYWNPAESRISKYFPDFLIQTDKDRFLVVEVKDSSEKTDYEANKKRYDGTTTSLSNVVFAKEVGFQEFQRLNQNFDYKILFDASLQEQQRELFDAIRGMER